MMARSDYKILERMEVDHLIKDQGLKNVPVISSDQQPMSILNHLASGQELQTFMEQIRIKNSEDGTLGQKSSNIWHLARQMPRNIYTIFFALSNRSNLHPFH